MSAPWWKSAENSLTPRKIQALEQYETVGQAGVVGGRPSLRPLVGGLSPPPEAGSLWRGVVLAKFPPETYPRWLK